MLFGFLNIHKPSGITSRDVVNHVQPLVRPAKTGHCGTLDPLASGVLVIAIGPATRLVEYVQRGRKRYIATFLLGQRSETEDIEGNVQHLADDPRPTQSQLCSILPRFTGEIRQRPPVYSALKVKGRRAYKLARRGEPVELRPRPVSVYRLDLMEYDYPQLRLDVECGSGTYIRSLGRDIAGALGTSAVMSELVRTAVGSFSIQDACELNQLEDAPSVAQWLQPAATAVSNLPQLVLTPAEARRVATGLPIQRELSAGDEFAAIDHAGRLLATMTRSGQREVRAAKNFPPDTATRGS